MAHGSHPPSRLRRFGARQAPRTPRTCRTYQLAPPPPPPLLPPPNPPKPPPKPPPPMPPPPPRNGPTPLFQPLQGPVPQRRLTAIPRDCRLILLKNVNKAIRMMK